MAGSTRASSRHPSQPPPPPGTIDPSFLITLNPTTSTARMTRTSSLNAHNGPPAPTESHKKARRVVDTSDDEEYSNKVGQGDDVMEQDEQNDDEDEDEDEVKPKARKGARAVVQSDDEDDFKLDPAVKIATTTASGRRTSRPVVYDSSTDDEEEKEKFKQKGALRRGSKKNGSYKKDDFVASEEDDNDMCDNDRRYGSSKRRTRSKLGGNASSNDRKSSKSKRRDSDVSFDSGDVTSEDEDVEELNLHDDDDDDSDIQLAKANQPRQLREKGKIDYYRPLDITAATNGNSGDGKGKKKKKRTPFSEMGKTEWSALYPGGAGAPPSDSSSDDDGANPFGTPRKGSAFPMGAAGGFGGMFAGGAAPLDLAGTPSNLGKVGGPAALADTDPLGVSSSVSFDSVGGLGSHIQQLKEMVSLPLLYPEVFERFNITPPRGVLFHGPPGTGKTLLARALAASCSTEGRKISFFMRKGADCLSKWVGEAERQLRLLFEEAKKCQPSIIFFDEIDGLAPVRSSKQEQIHASIVSTLLALMDGMDGRGQVIVIGATNRPDAIDPALRRPGRFDREFYFPLPNRDGRRKIIDIHTSGWNPPIADSFKDELAMLTKGYGGADLRALCTEAALNAVQRTYPQIYKTNERLVIEPTTIDVTARDFVISQKNLIPSSARATSSAAAPLPPQLVPLLSDSLEAVKTALKRVLPDVKKANVLEEAEYEDDGGGFEKEKMLQAYETLRIFRPRMLICGETGMGQSYIGAAALHHLEGFHVQGLDLATLVSDSGRTMEAACVQLFIEAKRHKPSILFIPNLITWCESVSDAVKSTIKGLLEGLDPSDPILLLAIVDGKLDELPSDVRSWFGFVKNNRVVLGKPSSAQRRTFFNDVIDGVRRPPNEFPDVMPRRKRILAELPIAPPPPPREPTAAEVEAQTAADKQLMDYLIWRLTPILSDLKKTFRRFARSLYDDWIVDDMNERRVQQQAGKEIIGHGKQPYFNVNLESMAAWLYKGHYYTPDEFLDDILRIQYNAEVNRWTEADQDAPIKAGQMVNRARVMLDQNFDPAFKAACAKMSERLIEKEKKGLSKARKTRDPPPAIDFADGAKAAAAAAGGRVTAERRVSMSGAPKDGEEDVAASELRTSTKRARFEDGIPGSSAINGGEEFDAEGPSKRPRGVDGIIGAHTALDSTTSTSSSVPILPSALPGGQFVGLVPNGVAPTPIAVGATPSLNSAETLAFAMAPLVGNAIAGPSGASISPIAHPESASAPAPAPAPAAPAAAAPSSPIVVDSRTPEPEPLPDFVLSSDRVESLWNYLSEGTDALNVDQLEQLRAACYDIIWHGKTMWQRDAMVDEMLQMAKEFVAEVQEANESEFGFGV
ncbi:BZ3500_MvSof-1268-A1-R1_Chr1-3g01971 [Microbotryum saponariae]|uniref:BZ3500_MvSof-1268-A1-R1_Chr1-3g01971 protein n=1 Tax=Microbotryum saponariae TaxID=289078 RepID=A0A2X0KC27_9BASI|nr:BZ3500_MvSof-1268-A1-R1_Chr1-3g01971 [Microbotryum saponariae]SCZ95057.1 BZ3501_MvSof-1269-A2-R1_Chr1-3g01573 [Microbotryum saponariae]